MNDRPKALCISVALALTASCPALADTFTFEFSSGGATTGAFTTSDTAAGTLAGAFFISGLGNVSALSATVAGADGGNGSFALGDFNNMFFASSGPLDFTANLANDANLSDFNLFSPSGGPNGVAPELIRAGSTNMPPRPGTSAASTSTA